MILTARRSLVHKMARNQAPKIEIFFLNISVRRANVSTSTYLHEFEFPAKYFSFNSNLFFIIFFTDCVRFLKGDIRKTKRFKKEIKS